ncbi:MAG TPA: hypothetical protein VGF75_03355, partial [Candidatus Saccharimonadales bacterium]
MFDEPTNLKTIKLYWRYWMRHPGLLAGSLLLGPAYVLQNIVSLLFIARAVGHLASYHTVSWHYVLYSAISLVGGICLWYICDKLFSMPLDAKVLHDMYEDSFHH